MAKQDKCVIFLYMILPLILNACHGDEEALNTGSEVEVTQPYDEVLNFNKDKARYNPGEKVTFSVNETTPNTWVRYKYLGKVITEEPLSSTSWTWNPPREDFQGYMVELLKKTDRQETIIGTVGVDVSSDWTQFPRYGFLSEFGNISAGEMMDILNNLKDFHINGLQYYDWHYKHHIPLPVDKNGNVADSWTDVFNREIYLETVEHYISQAGEMNMASMFYNLLYGVLNADEADGVSQRWLLYSDRTHNSVNRHELGDFGDILLTNPSNEEWQNYIFDKTRLVYENLDFAGWHLDQLGNRGKLYDYNGYEVPLPEACQDFLGKLKDKFPEKKMVLNAVDQFGQKEILNSPVDFSYTEVWSRYRYQDLAEVILENNKYSSGNLNTVLAAYMDYEAQDGAFNTPGVLLADAVIFAFGGAHLELGEHMLSSEYFPDNKLSVDPDLKAMLKEYYDFLVAYQNLLRDGGNFDSPDVSSVDNTIKINNWPPVYGQTAVVGKGFIDKRVIHLLNFEGVKTLQWRDNNRNQTIPEVKANFAIEVVTDQNPGKVWFASPDISGGASRELEFRQKGNKIIIEIPYLKYWSMIVLDY